MTEVYANMQDLAVDECGEVEEMRDHSD